MSHVLQSHMEEKRERLPYIGEMEVTRTQVNTCSGSSVGHQKVSRERQTRSMRRALRPATRRQPQGQFPLAPKHVEKGVRGALDALPHEQRSSNPWNEETNGATLTGPSEVGSSYRDTPKT